VLLDAIPVAETNELRPVSYQPRGTNPLYDAIGERVARLLQHRLRCRVVVNPKRSY